jgi:hypothetical protein
MLDAGCQEDTSGIQHPASSIQHPASSIQHLENMNCERCQSELEDFLYGELSEALAAGIRAHLGACMTCAVMRDEIERENELFARFYERTALEPSGQMWEAIRSRIDAKPALQPAPSGGGWLTWLFRPAVARQMAFAAVLIALSVAATTFFLKRDKEERQIAANQNPPVAVTTPQPAATPAPAMTPSPAPVVKPVQPLVRRKPLTDQEILNQQLGRAEREYRNAIKMLDQAIVKRKDSLDPALFKQYESSLALIDSSIAESRRALRERPNDLAAGQFLLAAYARKVELMQDIAMR